MHTLPQKQRLLDLLLKFSQESDPADRANVEQQIWDEFGVDVAVFVLDMSGFSRLTQRHGVVHYLSMVRRMQLTAEPILTSFSGKLVKFEADNCFAVFPDAEAAVRAAVNINQALDAANLLTPDELDIGVGCGIDVGKVLLLDEPSRGIDVAAKSEIFEIMNQLANQGFGILFASSELKEIIAVADRILVLSKGVITGEFLHGEATEDALVAASAIGHGINHTTKELS